MPHGGFARRAARNAISEGGAYEEFLNGFLCGSSGFSLLIVFLVSFAQVVQRYLFSMSIPWATDVIRIFFIYSVFCGIVWGLSAKKHLDIDVLVQLVSPKIRFILRLVSNGIVMFLSAVLWYSISFIEGNADQTLVYFIPHELCLCHFSHAIVVMLMALFLDTYKMLFGKKREAA